MPQGSLIQYLISGVALVIAVLTLVYFKFHIKWMKKAIKEIRKHQAVIDELYSNHFKVTDQTILDLREDKNIWKAKALKLEKKLKT